MRIDVLQRWPGAVDKRQVEHCPGREIIFGDRTVFFPCTERRITSNDTSRACYQPEGNKIYWEGCLTCEKFITTLSQLRNPRKPYHFSAPPPFMPSEVALDILKYSLKTKKVNELRGLPQLLNHPKSNIYTVDTEFLSNRRGKLVCEISIRTLCGTKSSPARVEHEDSVLEMMEKYGSRKMPSYIWNVLQKVCPGNQ